MICNVSGEYALNNNSKSFFDIQLECSNIIHEFEVSSLLGSYSAILEGDDSEAAKLSMKEKIKKLWAMLKEKIEELFRKVYDAILAIYAKYVDYCRDKVQSNPKHTFFIDSLKARIRTVIQQNDDKYIWYSILYPEDLTKTIRDMADFKHDNKESILSVSEIMNRQKYSIVKDYDNLVEGLSDELADPNMSAEQSAAFKKDLKDLKDWRDKALKCVNEKYSKNELHGDIAETTYFYSTYAKCVLNVYQANLKMYIQNSKTRMQILKDAWVLYDSDMDKTDL